MAICNKCGQQVGDSDFKCRKCGSTLIPTQPADDSKPILFGLLGILLSFFGILWGVLWKNSHPQRSKALIIGGVISFVIIFIIKIAQPLLVMSLLN